MARNITFTADERLIDDAREVARAEGTTLNEQFRLWLEHYARRRQTQRALETLERCRGKVVIGRRLTRDELNER